MSELAQRSESLEQEYDESAAHLDQRESDVAKREADASTLKTALAERKAALDKRATALDGREKSIKAQEVETAENTVPGDGVYVVGEDVKAGSYKTAGPNGGNPVGCYYSFKSGTGSDADIIDNNIVNGQASVALRPGQVFETSSCEDWTRQ